MSESSYDLVFRGECLPDSDPEQVRVNLGKLLKLDATQLAKMFSGRTSVIRRGADREYAARFQQAFKQAGARLRVVPVETNAEEPKPATKPDPRAPVAATNVARPRYDGPTRKPSLAERLAAQAAATAPGGSMLVDGTLAWQKTKAPTVQEAVGFNATRTLRMVDAGQLGSGASKDEGGVPYVPPKREVAQASDPSALFQLAPVGADMLTAAERARSAPPPVAVDISGLAVAPAEGNLPTLPRASADTAPPPIPDLTISPPGVDLGERHDFVELHLDLSHLSLAELGARMAPERVAVVTELDLSGLSLAPWGTPLRA